MSSTSSSEENVNLVKCAEEICEVFADSVSSLVLMLVALQEKNKPPKPEMQVSIQAVAEQANNIGQIAKDLAEEDYEEYPDIQKEILDASDEVFSGSEELTKAAANLKGSNLQEGYQQLVEGCRVCGTNCIMLLQIVYGATFKKLAMEQENIKILADQLDSKLVDDDPQRFADIAGDLVSAALQLAEDLKTQADGESIPSNKEEMLEIAQNIEQYANELLDAVNDFLEDPDDDDKRIKYEEAKERLMNEMDRAKNRIDKSYEIVKAQQDALAAQTDQQNAMIDDKISNMRPVVPKEEQIKRGKDVLDRLDKAGEAVFWNNPKEFVGNTNENMKEIPQFVDGRLADAKNEKKPEREEEIMKIKDDFLEFVDKAKASFNDIDDDKKKEDAIKAYKQERERIVKELVELGVDEEDIPERPQVDEATFDFDDDEDLIQKTDEAVKKIPKDRLEKLKENYKRLEAMEYAAENGEAGVFIENAKPLIPDVNQHAADLMEEATKSKDPKKKKVSEKLKEHLPPAIHDGQAASKDPHNKEKVEKGKENIETLKEDIVDALVAEGVPKKSAEKLLSDTQRDEEVIEKLIGLKQNAVEMKNALEKKNPEAFTKEMKESVPLVNEAVPKMKEKSKKMKEPMVSVYADNIHKHVVPVIKNGSEMVKDPSNEGKQDVTMKAVEEYIEAIDDALKKCKATSDEMKVVPKNKIDSELSKRAEKTKEKVEKVMDALFDEDKEELNKAEIELAEAESEMMKLMKEEAKKSKNKEDEKRIEKFEDEMKEVTESLDNFKKAPKEKIREKRQKGEEKLREYHDLLVELQEEEGRPIKEKEKAQMRVDKDLQKMRSAIENAEAEKIKEASGKLMEDFSDYKKLKEADGEKIDDVVVAVKEAHAAAIASAREPKNVIKKKDAVEKVKKCRDKLYGKPEKPKTEEKLNQEALKEIEEIEAHAESIILNDEEELFVALQDIVEHAMLAADALEEEDEEKVKAAKEGLEKAIKRKNELFDKAMERCSEKDRELLKKANEKLSKLNDEMVKMCEDALEDGDMKGRAEKARKNAGETAKVAQPMKTLITKPSEIRADDAAQALLEDCKLAEKVAKNPSEALAKECKEKLKRDMDRYEKAIKEMLENADLTPEEKEKLAKQLEDARKKQKEMDKYLERLMKDPKDEEARKGLAESAKELSEIIERLNEDFDVKEKSQAKKTQKAIEKCKEAAIIKDKKEGDQALAELLAQEEELLKCIDERISREKNDKKKKEFEKDKEMIKMAIDECREVTKKALETKDDDDILGSEISCELANAAVERFKERLNGGKTNGTKNVSAADRMECLAKARKALKEKDYDTARKELEELKKMLQAQLDDPNLDPATRAFIEDMIAKIDQALADLENAEASGLMSQISDMNAQLTTMLSNDITEQAKAKTRAKGIAARARAGKKSNLKDLVKGARDLANKMKGLKFNVKDEARDGLDELSEAAKAALALDDLLDDMSNGVDLDGMLESMPEEVVIVQPKNRLEAEITAVANIIKETQVQGTPSVCGDIAIHFRELAKHAANANKEGIILEGRTIAAAIAQFCKELQKAQPICKDRRTADDMARAMMALKNLSTQLKIVCSVKAATVGKGDADADNQLIAICQNIGTNLKQGMESLEVANKANLLKK